MNLADELHKLAELHRQGLLTEQEFAAAKQRLLAAAPEPAQALAPARKRTPISSRVFKQLGVAIAIIGLSGLFGAGAGWFTRRGSLLLQTSRSAAINVRIDGKLVSDLCSDPTFPYTVLLSSGPHVITAEVNARPVRLLAEQLATVIPGTAVECTLEFHEDAAQRAAYDAEQAKLQKKLAEEKRIRDEAIAKAIREQEEQAARIAKAKAEEEERLELQRADEEARLAKQQAEEEARIARQKAEEAARLAKQKAEEDTRLEASGRAYMEDVTRKPRFEIPALSLVLIRIPAGTFTMGSSNGNADESNLTRVRLSQFWLGETEVTRGQWSSVMGNSPTYFRASNLPVEEVSYSDAQAFCAKLNERERAAGRLPLGYAYALPTEAQWEYACRAGTKGDYAGDLDEMAWYNRNSGNTTHPVGTKKANTWGLFDMHGNVWEWCSDWYGDYPGGSVTDYAGPPSGTYRVCRGGSWNYSARDCRSANRFVSMPTFRGHRLGFRIALLVIADSKIGSTIMQSPAQAAPTITSEQMASSVLKRHEVGMDQWPWDGFTAIIDKHASSVGGKWRVDPNDGFAIAAKKLGADVIGRVGWKARISGVVRQDYWLNRKSIRLYKQMPAMNDEGKASDYLMVGIQWADNSNGRHFYVIENGVEKRCYALSANTRYTVEVVRVTDGFEANLYNDQGVKLSSCEIPTTESYPVLAFEQYGATTVSEVDALSYEDVK